MAEEESKPPEHGGALHAPKAVTGKIGPLPLWAWVVVGAGVIGAVLVIRGKRPSASTPAVGQQAADASGVLGLDPLTGEQLLAAISGLTAQLQAGSLKPPSSVPGTSSLDPRTNLPWVLDQVGGIHTGPNPDLFTTLSASRFMRLKAGLTWPPPGLGQDTISKLTADQKQALGLGGAISNDIGSLSGNRGGFSSTRLTQGNDMARLNSG